MDAVDGEPGTVRPGGRTARVRESVLRAAGDALVEQGFDGLDLADVARRAEVGDVHDPDVDRAAGGGLGVVDDDRTGRARRRSRRRLSGAPPGSTTRRARGARPAGGASTGNRTSGT